MYPIRTLLVDDEYLALNLLEEFIRQTPDLSVVDKIKSPLKALEVLNQTPVDLLFLDIQMPVLSGNNLLKTLYNPPVVIFTTAYADYAVEAYGLNVVDYLLKPFSFERFLQALNKAREMIHLRRAATSQPTLLADTSSETRAFLSLKSDGKIKKIFLDEILYIEGLKEYVRFICHQEKVVTLESLRNLESSLPADQFIRVHKSYIVAKNKVKAVEGNLLEIGSSKIPISREKREEVIKDIFYGR